HQLVAGYQDARPDAERVAELAAQLQPEDVQLFYQLAARGRRDLGLAPDARTGFEMTLLRMLAFHPARVGTPTSSAGGAPAPSRADAPAPAAPAPRAPAASRPTSARGNGQEPPRAAP